MEESKILPQKTGGELETVILLVTSSTLITNLHSQQHCWQPVEEKEKASYIIITTQHEFESVHEKPTTFPSIL